METQGVPPVRDPALWEHVKAAFESLTVIAEYHLNAPHKSVPTRLRPTLTHFDGGWPRISVPSAFADGPPHPSRIFGFEPANNDRLVQARNVTGVHELIAHVRSRPDLLERLCILRNQLPVETDERERVVQRIEDFEISQLPLQMLDRAYALDRFDDESVREFYRELERARLDKVLDIELVVPLLLTSFDLDESFEIDDEVLLAPLRPDEQLARATQWDSISGVPEPLIGAATHALVIREQKLDNSSVADRVTNGSSTQISLDLIDIACQAIAICSSRQTGYCQVLIRPLGWADSWKHDLPVLEEAVISRRYPDQFDDFGWLSRNEPIKAEAYDLVPEVFSNLRTAPAKVRLAARRYLLANTRSSDEDRIVDACIGIEALLGEGKDELSHRMALRAAAVLSSGPRPMKARVVYRFLKTVYDYRSAIVHGEVSSKKSVMNLDKAGTVKLSTVNLSVQLLQALLLSQLTSFIGGWTTASLDERLLGALDEKSNEPRKF